MFRDIKRQIALQTREKFGLIDVGPTQGYGGRGNKPSITIPGGGDTDNKPTISWDRFFYTYRRALYSADQSNILHLITSDFAPTLDPNLENEPTYGNGKFFNYWVYNGQIQHGKTNANPTGNIRELNIAQDANIAYAINIAPGKRGGSSAIIKMRINGTNLNCSVFLKHKGQMTAEYYELLYSTGGDWMYPQNKYIDEQINFQVGSNGTEVWILLYKHYEIHSENPGNDYFYCDVDLSAFASNLQSIGTQSNISPVIHQKTPYVTSSHPVTGNTIVQLRFDKPNATMWRGMAIYRVVDTAPGVTVDRAIVNNPFMSCVALSTSNINMFSANDKILYGSTSYTVNLTYKIKANRVTNGDFSDYSGHHAYNWLVTHSHPVTVGFQRTTAYPYKAERLDGPNSFRLYANKTNTAKAIYVQSSAYIKVGDLVTPQVAFSYKLDTGLPVGAFTILFYSSNNGTACYPASRTYYNLGVTTAYTDPTKRLWNDFSQKLANRSDTSSPSYMPYNCQYLKLRFYGCDNSTTKAGYILDGMRVTDSGGMNTFHTSQVDRAVIAFSEILEKPKDIYTGYNTIFAGTTKSWRTNQYAAKVFNRPMYIASSYIPHKYGIAIVDSAYNLLGNGALESQFRLWTNNRCLWMQNTSTAASPWGGLYHTAAYVTIYGNGTAKATLSQSRNGAANSWYCGHSSFPFAVWIRSHVADQQFKLKLDDLRTVVSSVTFSASNDWRQYTIYNKFNGVTSTVRASFIVDSGSPWMFDWAGAQLEGAQAGTNTKGYISAFNHLNTAQSTLRRTQGIVATVTTKLDNSYGTIRFWYRPFLAYNTGNSRVFYNKSRGASYDRIWYDKPNGKFRFDNYHTTVGYSASVSGFNFATASKIYVAAVWNSAYATLYVNTSVSKSVFVTNLSSTYGIHIGCSVNTTLPINGILSNFRIDKYPWNEYEVASDKYANVIDVTTSSGIKKTMYYHVGDVSNTGDDGKAYIEFTDDNGLLPDMTYYYTAALFDTDRNLGPYSSVLSVRTTRQEYEYYKRNLIANGSFEYWDAVRGVYGWSTVTGGGNNYAGNVVHNTAMFGNKSFMWVFNAGTNYLRYDGIELVSTVTTRKYSLSYYTFDNNDQVSFAYMNRAILQLRNSAYAILANKSLGAVGTDWNTTGAIDQKGNRWVRYSSSFVLTTNHDYASRMKYATLDFSDDQATNSLIDGVQFELGSTVTPFIENYYVGNTTLGPNSIDSETLTWNGIIGKHFKNREIKVAGGTDLDVNRIIIGTEDKTKSFAVLSTAFFRWHAPGMATTKGWNYTKHIESGSGIYGTHVNFTQRYYSWTGATATPILSLTPKELVTYSSAVATKIVFGITATSGGFLANAYLMTDTVKSTYTNFNKMWKRHGTSIDPRPTSFNPSNSQVSTASCIYSVFGGTYSEVLTTVLPTQSKQTIGIWSYGLAPQVLYGGVECQTRVLLYSTNSVTTAFSNSNAWRLLGDQVHTMIESGIPSDPDNPSSGFYSFSQNISTSHFARAQSVAIVVEPFAGNQLTQLDPGTLTYFPDFVRVLRQGSEVGKFYYTAFDGGVMG